MGFRSSREYELITTTPSEKAPGVFRIANNCYEGHAGSGNNPFESRRPPPAYENHYRTIYDDYGEREKRQNYGSRPPSRWGDAPISRTYPVYNIS